MASASSSHWRSSCSISFIYATNVADWWRNPRMKNNIRIYSPQFKYLCNYQCRHASESRATDTTDNSGGHISQSKCNLQFGRESRVFTIFIAVSRPRDGWYMNTKLLWIHACNIIAGSCKLQLQGRKSLTWSEDSLLSHNVIDIWISGLWSS